MSKRGKTEGSKRTRFKPGNKAAAGHGPWKNKPFKAALERVLTDGDFDAIAQVAKRRAKAGDPRFIFELRDTLDGKPRQEIGGPEGGAIPVSVEGVDEALGNLLGELKGDGGN